MPVLADYVRFRWLWGAVDWQSGSESPYTSAQTGANLGTSAAAGVGVGVRRAVLHFNRATMVANADDSECHFDFLNITGGDPDDTWTPTDYTTLEGYLATWWGSIKNTVKSSVKLDHISWYRHGPGINPPNPAERVTTVNVAGTGVADTMPPQVAQTTTFRTGVRRSWGRTYLPAMTIGAADGGTGKCAVSVVDELANAAGALLASAVAHDFPLVVTSKHLNAVLNVEAVEVDDLFDVIRRRRWKQTTYRKILTA